jgi:hypothetical protein
MPVLALGESGDGRAIALGLDGTHLLAFSALAVESAGRAYGALWEGLLGWLMRDPRYESARIELIGECIAGEPVTLRVFRLPGAAGAVSLELVRLGDEVTPPLQRSVTHADRERVEIELPGLEPGGYTARVRLGPAPPTRFDFACERGGEAWADSRPDSERLARLSRASGGVAVDADSVDALPPPEAKEVQAERQVRAVLPPWAWSLLAAVALGGHWVVRRRGGLA